MANPQIHLPREEIAEFCRRNHIRRLSLFGSALGDAFKPDSDIDLLVEFQERHTPGYLGLASMERELSELTGRKVDLRTPEELSRYFREDVLAWAEPQYVEE